MSSNDPKDGKIRGDKRPGKIANREPQRRDDAAGSGISSFLKDKRPRTVQSDYERNESRQRREGSPERFGRRDDAPRRSYNPNFTAGNRRRDDDGLSARNNDRETRDFNRQDTSSDGPRHLPAARKSPYPQYGASHRSEGYGGRNDRPRRDDNYSDRDDQPRRTGGYGRRDDSPYKKDFGNRNDRPNRDGGYGGRNDRPRRDDNYSGRDDRPHRTGGYGRRDDSPYKKDFGGRNDRPRRDDNYGGRDDQPRRTEGYGGRDNSSYRKDYGNRDNRSRRNEGFGGRDDRPRHYPSGSRKYDDRKGGGLGFSKPAYGKDDYPRFEPPKATGAIRLNRFIANSGVSSRREADDLIRAGVVTVNGEVIVEMGAKVLPTDEIRFNGELLRGEKKVYILMNKPRGYVTSVEDPHADKLVMDLLGGICKERVYPVGRLDKNSVGVLLITNDGELTRQLTHPSYNKKKIYQVTLEKPVSQVDMQRLADGVELDDGLIYADEVSYVNENRKEVGIEIHSGRNRVVRRMFEILGYTVTKLDRVYFGGLTKKRLKRGAWRFLTPAEVARLKSGGYE